MRVLLRRQCPAALTCLISRRFCCCLPADAGFACRSNIDNNMQLGGFLPGSWRSFNPLQMTYSISFDIILGMPVNRGPDNYGQGGAQLYTSSGPLWRTKIVNWEGLTDNAAANPNPQPSPDPCVADPLNSYLCQ
jgi:hypothetical protein